MYNAGPGGAHLGVCKARTGPRTMPHLEEVGKRRRSQKGGRCSKMGTKTWPLELAALQTGI